MASNIDISGLTMNPLEVDSISEFVVERTFNDPTLQAIHAVWTGVQMKEQIVFVSQSRSGGSQYFCVCTLCAPLFGRVQVLSEIPVKPN